MALTIKFRSKSELIAKRKEFNARGSKGRIEVIITDKEMAHLVKDNDLYRMGFMIKRLKEAGIPCSDFFLYAAPESGKLTSWRDGRFDHHFIWEK